MEGDDAGDDGRREEPEREYTERDEAAELADAITDLVVGVTPPFDQRTTGTERRPPGAGRGAGERGDAGRTESGGDAETEDGDDATPAAVATDVVRGVDDLLTEVTPPVAGGVSETHRDATARTAPGRAASTRSTANRAATERPDAAPDGDGREGAARLVAAINDMVAGVVPPATGESATERSDAEDERAAGLVGMLDSLLTGVAAPSIEVVANRLHALEGVRLELASVTGVVHVEVESAREAVHIVRHQQAAVRQLDEMLAAGGFTGRVRVDGVQVGRLGTDADPGRWSRWLADGRTEVDARGFLAASARGTRKRLAAATWRPSLDR